jgi:hypothetical protein
MQPFGSLVLALGMLAPAVVPLPLQAADVALMAGQRARPLNGTFNRVPVLHSNQPEEVEGPGILISTAPGAAYAAENGQPLRNAEYTFNGDFGLHMHHKYFPTYRRQIQPGRRRTELTLGVILINSGRVPVSIRFERGAVRNSFQAPYLANHMLGVKPLGPRPWNTGPGDATAVQMLRDQLDRALSEVVVIPPRSRIVLFSTPLPALGIANALLRGRSNGPFQMAVVAASNPQSDADLIAVLDSRRLAPGRVYLNRVGDIQSRRVFSRVGGVAIGDAYQAELSHDLRQEGPLHVPLTSTNRHHFGTQEVQVNPLEVRMLDSSLDNVGTYGVRFDVDLNLKGSGSYDLVLSHPRTSAGRKDFVAFRGSLQVRTPEGLQEMHLGMRSGESHALASLQLQAGTPLPVRVSLVYPADATPGHLLSVVPSSQLAMVQARQRQQPAAVTAAAPVVVPVLRQPGWPTAGPPPVPPLPRSQPPMQRPAAITTRPQLQIQPTTRTSAPTRQPPRHPPAQTAGVNTGLLLRYQEAMEAQQQLIDDLISP